MAQGLVGKVGRVGGKLAGWALWGSLWAVGGCASPSTPTEPGPEPAAASGGSMQEALPAGALRVKERAVLSVGPYRVAGWSVLEDQDPRGATALRMKVSVWRDGDEDHTRDEVLFEQDTLVVGEKRLRVSRVVPASSNQEGFLVLVPAEEGAP